MEDIDYPPTRTCRIADRLRASENAGGYPKASPQPPLAPGASDDAEHAERKPPAEALQVPVPWRNDEEALPMPHVETMQLPIAPPMPPVETMRLPIPDNKQGDEEKSAMLPMTKKSSEKSAMLPIRRRSSDISDAPPTLSEEGPPMLPFACIGADAEDSGLFLPTVGLNAGAPNDGILLPFEARSSVPLEERRKYVTDTVTTPVSSGYMQSTSRPWPVPLTSLGPSVFGSCIGSGIQNAALQSSLSCGVPRWARSLSSYSSPGGVENETPPSLGASLNASSFAAVHKTSSDSHHSIRWTPDAFVQCWHRKLSETYQDYNMVNIVGEGRSGAVFIVQNKATEKFVACKALNKKDQDMSLIRSEIETLRHLDHPNIVRLHEVNEDQEFVFLLMELCLGGDLFLRISDAGHLSENHSCVFAQQMISALAYCHSYRIVHRDVKPENFLLETDSPDCLKLKLADFGIATSIRPAKLDANSGLGSKSYGLNSGLPSFIENSPQAGSLPYMAPELISGNWSDILKANVMPTSNTKDERANVLIFAAADLWGVGVVIYVMLTGCLPFGTDPAMICSGLPPDFSGEIWSHVSEEAISLILDLLKPNLKERWTAKQALGHRWFKDVSTNDLGQNLAPGGTKLEDGLGGRTELASHLLRSLREFRKMGKLRRIAFAAIAKKLEATHEAQKIATAAFKTFSNTPALMKCEDLVKALHLELPWEVAEGASFEKSLPQSVMEGGKSFADKASLTGYHLRHRLKRTFSRLARVGENTPKIDSSSNVQLLPEHAGDLVSVSLIELRALVSSLDGLKNGLVDYTLLVAALMPPEVYQDQVRIAEVFDLFDFQKKGKVRPEDICKILNAKSADLRDYKDLIKEFDVNGDGVLDMAEFQAMICGAASSGFYSAQRSPSSDFYSA